MTSATVVVRCWTEDRSVTRWSNLYRLHEGVTPHDVMKALNGKLREIGEAQVDPDGSEFVDCPRCGAVTRAANYCSMCGGELPEDR